VWNSPVAPGAADGRFALPGVEADVVVIAAGRNERRAVAHPLHHLEAEHAAVKPQRPSRSATLR